MAITGATFGSGVTVTGGITVVGGDYAGAVIAGINTTPFINAWSWDSVNGFGTKYSNPGTLPSYSGVGGVVMNPDGTVVAMNSTSVTGNNAAALIAYQWSDATGFGTKYTDASSYTSNTGGHGIVFTPQNNAVIIGFTNALSAWVWDNSTGFGTKYTNSATATGASQSVAINPAGTAVVRGYTNGLVAFPWNSSTGFGTAYSDPTGLAADYYNITFNNAGNVLFGANNGTTPWINAWAFNDSTGFGTKFSNPAVAPSGTSPSGRGVTVTPNDDAVIMAYQATSSPGVIAWAWNNTTGFGTKYANPSVSVGSPGGNSICMSPDGKAVLVMETSGAGSPYMIAYAWNSTTGFGAKYSDPGTAPGGLVRSITFSSYQRYSAAN